MFTQRYIVLGVTKDGCVDRVGGLRGTDPREVCERALEKFGNTGRPDGAYKQLILISIGRDGDFGSSLNVSLYQIERIERPTFTLQPVQAYLGRGGCKLRSNRV